MRHRSSRMTVLIVILVVVCTLSVWATWDDNGTQVSLGERNELSPRIAPDTVGGAYIAWEQHFVSSMLNPSIFVQRINGDGLPLWTPGGTMLTEDTYMVWSPVDIAPVQSLPLTLAAMRISKPPHLSAGRSTGTTGQDAAAILSRR
jgi:hypothetical protein